MDWRETIATAVAALPSEIRDRTRCRVQVVEELTGLTADGLLGLLVQAEAAPEDRATAAWIAGLVDEPTLLPVLEDIVRDEEHPELLWEATKSLCSHGQGTPLFRRLLLTARHSERRRAAAWAVGTLADRGSVDLLTDLLMQRSGDPGFRGQCVESLGEIGERSALPVLVAAAEDPDVQVRYWAAFALGQLGDRRALPTLERLAHGDDGTLEGWGSVAEEARQSIEALGGPDDQG